MMLRENLSRTAPRLYADSRAVASAAVRISGRMLKSDAMDATKTGSAPLNTPAVSAVPGAGAVSQRGVEQIPGEQWLRLGDGLRQRFRAINAFLDDVLTRAELPEFALRDAQAAAVLSRVPRTLLGLRPLGGYWTWLAATDVYVAGAGEPLVLDHNLACPVGLLRIAELSATVGGREQVDRWVSRQLQPAVDSLCSGHDRPRIAVLDAGAFSSAFRENEYLAARTGGQLVRNRDLTLGPDGIRILHHGQQEAVDLLVRRVDDDQLDPNCFRPDSLVGVPGLVRACREGRAVVLNAPGTGLMNNRAVSLLIPEMIRHYLQEVPLLRSVATLPCGNPEYRDQVLSNLNEFAVRTIDPLHPSRPFFGNVATASERMEMTARLLRDPAQYVARPLLTVGSWRSGEGTTAAGPEQAAAGGFNLRVFAGLTDSFRLLPFGIGRTAQPDGGATLAIISDPSAFLVSA